MQVEVGKIYDGKITGITNFGAFVDIDKETTGLVHISEVALEYVKDIKEHLNVGQDVKVKVVSIDEKGKINLSIKKAIDKKRVRKNDNFQKENICHNMDRRFSGSYRLVYAVHKKRNRLYFHMGKCACDDRNCFLGVTYHIN